MPKFASVLDWVAAGSPAPPPQEVKMATIAHYMRVYNLQCFVETGTFKGQTSAAVAETGAKVITIELSQELHERALRTFASSPNVTCLQGDSGELLESVLSDLQQPALLWLDGHYSGGVTARSDKFTPVIDELIAAYHHATLPHVILIDDARCFGEKIYKDYPAMVDLEHFSRVLFPTYSFSVLYDIIRLAPPSPAV